MNNQCFGKTAKGNKELEERSGLLSPVARRVLIMMDGKRSCGDLLSTFSQDELEEGLARLELLKMVEEIILPEISHPAAAVQSHSPAIDKQALAQVKKIMHMSNQQYLAGKLDRFLDEDFPRIHNKAGLEPALEQWHKMLCDSGNDVSAYAYLRQIKATLGWG
ncbi:MAG: hypothetical protein ACRCU9_15245 [Iodobacter sp.]